MNPTAELLAPEIEELIRAGNYADLRASLHHVHPADVAEILGSLEQKDACLGFRFLQRDDAAAAFSYIPPDRQQDIITGLGEEAAAGVIERMSPDDRAHLVDELPEEVAQRIVASLSPQTRKVTQAILGYPSESVGRLMTPDYVTIKPAWTCAAAIDHIRAKGRDAETINVVYVVDDAGKLIDDIRLRQLLLAPPEALVETVMNRNFVTLRADQDREEAVSAMLRYDRTALPVVDSRGVLIGIVTSDDVADVAQAEVTEDMQKMGGSEALEEPYMATPLLELVRKRITWLAAAFIGEMGTRVGAGFFEHQLERSVILSLFIPLIVSSGGNSGSQASSLIIRAMALREISLRDWWRVFRRELACGSLLGLGLGMLGLIRIHVWQWTGIGHYSEHYHLVGFTILTAVFGIVLWGCIVGAMLPFVLKRIKLDPATSSAPFVATLVDVTGIVIYLGAATLILRTTLLRPEMHNDTPLTGSAEVYVVSATPDPDDKTEYELIVQTAEQHEKGGTSRVRVPLKGLPGQTVPKPGDHVRILYDVGSARQVESASTK